MTIRDVAKLIDDTVSASGAEIVERKHRKNGTAWIVIARGADRRKVYVPTDINEYRGMLALRTKLRRECASLR